MQQRSSSYAKMIPVSEQVSTRCSASSSNSDDYSTHHCNGVKRCRRNSVEFASNVRLRCFFDDTNNDRRGSPSAPLSQVPQDGSTPSTTRVVSATANPTWFDKDEVSYMRSRAKALSKLHYLIRCRRVSTDSIENGMTITNSTASSPQSSRSTSTGTCPATANIVNATRYEINGESLRGMEYITDATNGRKRRKVQQDALQAASSQGYYCSASVSSSSFVEPVCQGNSSSNLAKVYGSKSQDAYAYAILIAKEDATIAAEILTEDLAHSHPQEVIKVT